MKDQEFYNLLAIEAGIQDSETVKRVYLGLENFVRKSLVADGNIILPRLFDIRLHFWKRSAKFDLRTREMVPEKGTWIVKVNANRRLKEYFYQKMS
jgi:hypothetical protein